MWQFCLHIFESYKVKPTTFTTLGRMHNFIGKEFSYVFLTTSIFSCSILNSLYVWNLVSLFFLSYTGGLNKIKKNHAPQLIRPIVLCGPEVQENMLLDKSALYLTAHCFSCHPSGEGVMDTLLA